MAKSIFVNLPVADVARSTAFYEAIGLRKNEQFSNDKAAMLAWTDTITIGVLSHDFFATLTAKSIADPRSNTCGVIALSLDSKAEVDAMAAAAVAAGGRELHGAEDQGFMYSRGFEDPDGHGFGPFWIDPAAATGAMSECQPEQA